MLLAGIGSPLAAARAASYTWAGLLSNSWSNRNAWQGGTAPPNDLAGTDTLFGMSVGTSSIIDTPYSIHQLTFGSTASTYTFSGSALTLGTGGISQNSAATETFSTAPVVLGADQTWTLAAGSGALNFNAGLNTTGGPVAAPRALTINAATTTGTGNVLNGAVTGGGSLTKTGAGVLTFTGASTFTGAATINAGSLAVTGSLNGTAGLYTAAGGNLSIASGGKVTLGASQQFTIDGSTASPATGNLDGTASALSTGDAYVGVSGVAQFTQSAGSFTTNGGELYVGYNVLANGTYNLTGPGTLTAGTISVGDTGTGMFTQSAGTVTSSGLFILADLPNSHGTYQLSGTGALSANGMYIGLDGSGTLNQSGGQVTTSDIMYVGFASGGTNGGSNGLYLLIGDGSTLSTQEVYVGYNSNGRFDQKGGTVTTNGHDLHLGNAPAGTGTYLLDGANSVLSAENIRVGEQGTGTFTQSAGSVTTANGYLYLGGNPQGNGTYNLNGGTLTTARSQIGNDASTAVFNQNGGTHTPLILSLTGNATSSTGTYNLNGGTLVTGIVLSGNNGVSGTSKFNFNGGTLRASSAQNAFLRGLTTTNVQTGGALVDSNGFNVSISQSLLHDTTLTGKDGGLTKLGPGTLSLTGNNTYSGDTNVNGGNLNSFSAVGSAFGTGTVRINSGGVLSGIGGFAGSLFVNSGGTLTGLFNVGGNMTVGSGGLVTLSGYSMKVTGNVINNGTIRLTQGASIVVAAGSTFVNNGTLDIITGSVSAPGGFTNNSTVLNASTVQVKSLVLDRANNTATVTIDSYTGHTFQLWSTTDLAATQFAAVPNVPTMTGTTGQPLTFIDSATTGGQRFYRVVVDP